jgi:hypothetical protein
MEWDGFWTNGQPLKHVQELNRLIDLMRSGGDLTPYLSTRAMVGYSSKPGMAWQEGKSGHLDMALNAYGVHHLHLKPASDNGKRSGGSNELLFVGVSRDEVLLLLLGDHSSMKDGTLHRAVVNHKAGGIWTLKGVVAPDESHTDVEAVQLLRRGVSAPGVAGDKVVVAGLLSAAGTSLEHGLWADRICDFIEEQDGQLDTPQFRARIRNEWGVPVSDDAPLSWCFSHADFGLLNESTGVGYRLLTWYR